MEWYDAHDDRYLDSDVDYRCREYIELVEDISKSKEFLQGVLDQLYGNEKFDSETLEFYLGEALSYLNFSSTFKTYDKLKIKSSLEA